MLPVASCLVCGKEKELVVFVDPAITGGSFHGVCFQCRQAAQQSVQPTASQTDVPFQDVNSANYRFVKTKSG